MHQNKEQLLCQRSTGKTSPEIRAGSRSKAPAMPIRNRLDLILKKCHRLSNRHERVRFFSNWKKIFPYPD